MEVEGRQIISPHIPQAYDAFLSSGFFDLGDLKPVREEARSLFDKEDLHLWTWEHWSDGASGQKLRHGRDWEDIPVFELIAAFRRALLASGIMILFLATRRGSQIQPWADDLKTYGTFLELEVYFATVVRKPILFFLEEGAQLESPMGQLLELARRAGAIQHEETIARGELPTKALSAFRRFRNRADSPLGKLTELLAIRRDPKLDYRTTMPFLYDLSLPQISDHAHPNFEVIDRLLGEEKEPDLGSGPIKGIHKTVVI